MTARDDLIFAVRDYEDTHQGWPEVVNAIDAVLAEARAEGAADLQKAVDAAHDSGVCMGAASTAAAVEALADLYDVEAPRISIFSSDIARDFRAALAPDAARKHDAAVRAEALADAVDYLADHDEPDPVMWLAKQVDAIRADAEEQS